MVDAVEKDSAAYLKRREQVRRAQRTHRERKEAYIKSLENEVLQLRSNEANIMQETKNLYAEVGRLKRILDQHGIVHEAPHNFSLPSHLDAYSPHNAPSVISIRQNPGHQQQQVHVHSHQSPSTTTPDFYLSESDGSLPAAGGSSGGTSGSLRRKFSFFRGRGHSGSISNEDVDASRQQGQQLSTASPADGGGVTTSLSASTSNLSLRDMNETDLGMEFVLTLESPCLHHTQPSPDNPHAPTGHALTATAPLLFQSPAQPVDTAATVTSSSKPATTGTTGTTSTSWDTPHSGLERLLSLSTNFELSDELTPVQAWHQLRSHPDFSGIEIPRLRKFTEGLKKNVKCYGFGAVLETDVFFDLAEGLLFPRGWVWGDDGGWKWVGWGVPGVF